MKIFEFDLPQFSTLEILPFADVHIGDSLMDEGAVRQFIADVLEKENRYVIVNGDILNWASKNSVSDVYSETMAPNQQIDFACDLLEPIKDRILVMIDGNHEARATKSEGISPIYQVAKRLNRFDAYSDGTYFLLVLGCLKVVVIVRWSIRYMADIVHLVESGQVVKLMPCKI